MNIDLRSDTVTKPCRDMLEAMMSAAVGDDVFAEDPTVIKLEQAAAKMFGHEAAIFCPSGTMTNQIAIKVHTQPGDEVICHEDAHIFRYEGGGMAANAGVQPFLLKGNHGFFTLEQVQAAVHPSDSHYPRTALVAIENTTNRGGGGVWDWNEVKRISDWCRSTSLPFHMDGARLFNALVHTNKSAAEIGPWFDSISICLSKGLGCPVGSFLIGSKAFINEAHRIRKRMGGGMRQVGLLAAAGLFALENNVKRLQIDHDNAKLLSNTLSSLPWVTAVYPTETNIVIFETADTESNNRVLDQLKNKAVACLPFGPNSIRFVTHKDVTKKQVEEVCEILKAISL